MVKNLGLQCTALEPHVLAPNATKANLSSPFESLTKVNLSFDFNRPAGGGWPVEFSEPERCAARAAMVGAEGLEPPTYAL
jgi:hypothetical protein